MMKKNLSYLLALTLFALFSVQSVNAQESKLERVTAGPKAVAGALTGMTIGVPVNITKSIKRFTLAMHDSVSQNFAFNDESDLYAKTAATVLAVPYGLFSGMIYGTYKGIENGLIAGSERPFSRESFSLQE